MTTKALILAAGRGERMRPLTDHTPKPLLPVRGKPLMQWAMEALARGGFTELVINTAWLGEQITAHFKGEIDLQSAYLLPEQLLKNEQNAAMTAKAAMTRTTHLRYSHEGRDFGGALETAGGIVRALPMLCESESDAASDEAFWVLAGDVFAPDFVFSLDAVAQFRASGKLAHLWLVPNPDHNQKGDFGISAAGLALNDAGAAGLSYTFSTIALYRKSLFSLPFCDIPAGNPGGVKAALAPLLRKAIAQQLVSAELYTGTWTDVGTPERLAQINAFSPLE
ncbi:MAG: nucleotidyltransferase family protein [Burkholderiaceae bacterium]|nr:nucleotidyltransferase family protein [Burkholderiaceae bacterium]